MTKSQHDIAAYLRHESLRDLNGNKHVLRLKDYPYERVFVYEKADTALPWSGSITECPGCFACGGSIESTNYQLEDAFESWAGALLESGENMPTPIALQGKP